MTTFLDDEDRRLYRWLLNKTADHCLFRIYAYCLMTNHIHVVGVPDRSESLWKTFHRLHSIYAQHFNRKYGFSGHLWQGRPYSCPMDESHLWSAVRYVERNPVRAGMIVHGEDYPWSSARGHCGLVIDDLLDPNWFPHGVIDDWHEWLKGVDDLQVLQQIREKTFTGRPCGSHDFVRSLEVSFGRQLTTSRRNKTL